MDVAVKNSYSQLAGKKLMILGASGLQIPAITTAKAMGIYTIAVDFDDEAEGKPLADKFLNISTLDTEAVLQAAKEYDVDGILTICSDRPMTVVAKVGEELGLNTISVEASYLATDKGKMRTALRDAGVSIPKFFVCETEEECKNALKEINIPCIMKPADNSGSRGVVLLEEADKWMETYEYSKESSNNGQIIVEEYMVGPEVSVEVLVNKGIVNIVQVTDKITTGAPHFVEMGHTQPSNLSEAAISSIKETTKEAVKALKIDKGPAHAELIVVGDTAKIVEVGARLGGDYIATDLTPLSTGVDMVKSAILTSLGVEYEIEALYDRFSAIRYFEYDSRINFTNDVVLDLERVYISRVPHKELESSRDREGFFIVSGKSREELEKKIENVRKSIV